ncbi:MAG: hypothetical protein ACO2ZZ_05230 [Cyclobacteriaceae bacterium]
MLYFIQRYVIILWKRKPVWNAEGMFLEGQIKSFVAIRVAVLTTISTYQVLVAMSVK